VKLTRLAAMATGVLLIGSVYVTDVFSSLTTSPVAVEVALGALAAGSSAGTDGTNGVATITGTLLTGTTDLFYLNNSNATGPWHVKLALTGSSGVTNLALLSLGVDNGTTSTPQIAALLGTLTQTSGAYVQLEPGSTNRIYATQAVSVVGLPSTLTVQISVTQETNETTLVTYVMTLSIV
jgi:hypothetical protein